jgi:hypothetical protein
MVKAFPATYFFDLTIVSFFYLLGKEGFFLFNRSRFVDSYICNNMMTGDEGEKSLNPKSWLSMKDNKIGNEGRLLTLLEGMRRLGKHRPRRLRSYSHSDPTFANEAVKGSTNFSLDSDYSQTRSCVKKMNIAKQI